MNPKRVPIVLVLLAVSAIAATTIAIATPWAATGSTVPPAESPSVKIYTATMTVSGSPTSSSVTWTQPAKTIGHLYFRVRATTPGGGACTDNVGSVIGHYSLNGDGIGSINWTIPPGTTWDPLTGSHDPGPGELFPGTYKLDTVIDTSNLASYCFGTVFRTQVAVETVGG
jgi:hypothetical protein